MSASGKSQRMDQFFDNIASWSRGRRIVVCVVVILVLALLFYFASFQRQRKDIAGLKEKLSQLEKRQSVLQAKAKQKEKFERDLAEAERSLKLAMQLLPDKKEIPSLLANISQSGHDAGLEFLLFEPKPEDLKNFYAEIPVQMKIKGGYHDVGHFFEAVAGLPRIVNIRDITMAPAKPGEPLVTSCKAVTYKFVENQPEERGKKNKKNRKK